MGSSVGVRSETFCNKGWNVLVPPSLVFVGVGSGPFLVYCFLVRDGEPQFWLGELCFLAPPCFVAVAFILKCWWHHLIVFWHPGGWFYLNMGVSHLEVPPLLYNIFILMLSLQRTVPQSINGHARGKKRVSMTVIATWPCCITTVFQMSWLSCACLTGSCRCTVATCAVASAEFEAVCSRVFLAFQLLLRSGIRSEFYSWNHFLPQARMAWTKTETTGPLNDFLRSLFPFFRVAPDSLTKSSSIHFFHLLHVRFLDVCFYLSSLVCPCAKRSLVCPFLCLFFPCIYAFTFFLRSLFSFCKLTFPCPLNNFLHSQSRCFQSHLWIWSNFFATYTSFAPSTLPLSGFLFSPDNDNEYLRSLPSFPCLDLTLFFNIHSFRPPHFFFGSLFLFFIFLSLFVRAPRDCL